MRLVPKASVVLTWSLHFSRAFLVACGFGTTGFSLEKQIPAELCYRSLVYLAEATMGTRSHALLCVRSLIWRSPQEHLDRCTWLSVAGRFCKNKSPLPLLQGLVTMEWGFVLSNWPIGFGAIRIVKGCASRLVSWLSPQGQRDAQREWMKLKAGHVQVSHVLTGDRPRADRTMVDWPRIVRWSRTDCMMMIDQGCTNMRKGRYDGKCAKVDMVANAQSRYDYSLGNYKWGRVF